MCVCVCVCAGGGEVGDVYLRLKIGSVSSYEDG